MRYFFLILFLIALFPTSASAYTQCRNDADCDGQACKPSVEVVCADLKTQAANVCSQRRAGACIAAFSLGGVTFEGDNCRIQDGFCLLNESQFSQHCERLIGRVSEHEGKRYCEGSATPAAASPSRPAGPELKFEPKPPKLQIPIPTLPEFSKVELQGPEGDRYLLIPWLAQYFGALYRYGVSIVGIIATVMIVFGGMKWLTAAGDPGKITSAKETITNAVIGLVIALGTSVILSIINPEILKFKSLKISFVKQAAFEHVVESPLTAEEEAGLPGERPRYLCNSVASCAPLCANIDAAVPPGSPTNCDAFATLVGVPGIKNNDASFFCLRPEVKEKLAEVGRLAQADGSGPYEIHLNSAFRPIRKQLEAVCTKIRQGDTSGLGTLIGWPGGSIHGTGAAVDAYLVKNGTPQRNREGAKKLAELFFRSGWVRYCKEWWHFEYGTGGLVCRSNTCDWYEKSCTRP